MMIDIDKLTEAELIDLNNRIVARLRFLREMRAHAEMLDFKIGDRVTFQPDGHPPLNGMLTRYNEDSNGHHGRRRTLERLAESAAQSKVC